MARSVKRHAYYLSPIFDDFPGLIESIAKRLEHHEATGHANFDTIVGTGMSGALLVMALATRLGKHGAVVRKENDGSHSSNPVEGIVGKRWIFIDDLVYTGRTLDHVRATMCRFAKRIRQEAANEYGNKEDVNFCTQFAGTYCYFSGGWKASLDWSKNPYDDTTDLSRTQADAPGNESSETDSAAARCSGSEDSAEGTGAGIAQEV